LLSAFVRARAREDGKKLALLAEMPTTRRKEEQKLIARERVREPTLRRAAEELVGALWDLVPYGADPQARAALLKELWPSTPYQNSHWQDLVDLSEELAEACDDEGPLRDSRIPPWTTKAITELEEEEDQDTAAQVEAEPKDANAARARRLAEVIARSPLDRLGEIDPRMFANPRIAAFVNCFGAKAVKRLSSSSRPAVALGVCTSFLPLDKDSATSGWDRARLFLGHLEELVEHLEAAGNLTGADFLGGPFCADTSDLKHLVLSSEALESFIYPRQDRWDRELARIGALDNDESITEASRVWDEIFAGIPLMCEFLNEHLSKANYGCELDGYLPRPPRRPRLGAAYVSDDQIDEETSIELFCFGCEILSEHTDYLRVWLALWIGGLRPRESHVEAGDLVPYGPGFLATVPRRFGKTGWREAMFPRSAMDALGLTPDHLFPDQSRPSDPTAVAEKACDLVRNAWEQRRSLEPSLPAVPGRKAYFPREVMADVIRRHQRVPWVLTKAYGHETEASDQAYTQLTSTEANTMYQSIWAKLKDLMALSDGGEK